MKFLIATALLIFGLSATAKIRTETVEYKQGDTVLEGYLAYDDAKKGPRPGVIVVHEWMGLNEYAKSRAREMAKWGYVALAADVYGKGIRPQGPKEAGELAGKYKEDRKLMRARMQAALEFLSSRPQVKKDKIAAMGFCFGGTAALELARSGAPLSAVASFHGGLSTPNPEDGKNIKAKALIMTGGLDPYVKNEEVAAFKKEMDEAKVDYQLIVYANTVHAFTNPEAGTDPSKGAAYNASSEKRSIAAFKQFLVETLQ